MKIKKLYFTLVWGILFVMPSYANELMKKGIYKDSKTGLMWMRCSIGQKWNGKTCTGEATTLKWKAAMEYPKKFNRKVTFGGYKDWRLPTIAELSSIRFCSDGWGKDGHKVEIPNGHKATLELPAECTGSYQIPTINQTVFPRTAEYFYWSSTPSQYDQSKIWAVYFSSGSAATRTHSYEQHLRLVRDGK